MKRKFPLTDKERKELRASIDKTRAELDRAFAEDEKDFQELLRETERQEKLLEKH